jgi:hypothetical protein
MLLCRILRSFSTGKSIDKDYEYESESHHSSDDSSVDSNSDSDSDFDSDDEGPPELVRRMGSDGSSCSSSESESSSEDKDDDDDFFNNIDRIDRGEVYDILMESKSYERDERASNIIDSTVG